MEDWLNVLSPQLSPAQMIIFTERKFTSYNWDPPNISAIPINDSTSAFDLTDMAKIENYKRETVIRAITELNQKEIRQGYRWVISGLRRTDDALLLIAKVVQNN
ncbi:hypothetical protein TWF730_002652 [Orbilia blumenaviensis]|uniref:Uncharacterized protein n=1 Tax=Orbilia blumenaviensis TaxID=1796055 RepID=A0AAV9UDK2_9PEZI